jgi:RND family efflux transporter MFP subunit
MYRRIAPFALLMALAAPAHADNLTLQPLAVPDLKAVYARIEARDRLPARARLGGTLMTLTVAEGDLVTQGDVLAEIVDEKLGFQLSAIDAQITAATAQLENASSELQRGEGLLQQGVITTQRLDALRTQFDVLTGQIETLAAQRRIITQQAAEGAVLAPVTGRVLDVPVARGAVVLPGEAVAQIGGGGIFLRLAVPERHAGDLRAGDTIQIDSATGAATGTLARIYPLIENGRVLADVEVTDLADDFVDARVLVRLPVGTRDVLMVPATAITTHAGLDFVTLVGSGARTVIPGARHDVDGVAMVEILSGLRAGDVIETGAAQ